ncbi:B12-binding domain-containing radical SAM protein [Fusobacterium sp.]|uniref:B12-binding domain-containing radical SAM protein n=1 Tax=Fusobacterium sp. TaxID=68766 RepID=UPI002900E520|nr:radical SAM protein [Fusobacterium sp.]MDU1910121.1 radical SAM protein [Fusobacterium sp.]
MRIVFLAPAGAMHRYNGNFGKVLHYAPLTLTTLASLIPAEIDADVEIFDESSEKIPLNVVADLIVITCITGTAQRCYAYSDYFRSRGIKTVLGGVHPSLMPEESLKHADVVMTGFSEFTFPQMIMDFKLGHLKRLYAQSDEFTVAGKPLPRRDLLKKGYITKSTIEAVRGCSLPCTFCAYPAAFGKKIYKRPVREVIEEIETLNSKIVLFPDVNLIADREYAIELFREMIPLKKYWLGLATSAVGIDDELIDIFHKSGCKGLLIGFESISQDSQKYVNKGINNVSGYSELMKRLHDTGILVQGCFAFGGDEEDISVFERTVEAVIESKIDLPRYSILTPFPKTNFYIELEKQGRIIEHNWAMYDVEHCVFQPNKMTKEQLEEGTAWAWNETYKTKNILKRLAPFKHNPWLSLPLNFGYRNYAKKYEYFTKEVMCDNSDIPSIEGGNGR